MPLAYYARAATQEFWSEHWGSEDVETLLSIARRSPLTALIEAALPRGGLILESGCGLGQYVVLLRERGHRAVGVDWSIEPLRRCRKAFPAAPLAVADLGAVGVRDGAVAAYLSLGVVEHDPAGPERILNEARRILAPGGRLILSVPYLNGVRRVLRPYLAWRQERLRRDGGEFYQYAFTRREVRALLEARGFATLSLSPYDPARLLRKALRPLTFLLSPEGRGIQEPLSPPGGEGRVRGKEEGEGYRVGQGEGGVVKRFVRRLLYTSPLLRLLGHMILAVAVKR